MKELLRKKHSFPITFLSKFPRIFKKGKTITIEYRQATLNELLELGELVNTPESLTTWLYGFLCKNAVESGKMTLKKFSQLKTKNINEICSHIFKTYAKGYFTETKKGDKKSIPKQTAPDSSLFALIFEHSNETIDSILNLTWEQVEYLIDGMTWNLRGQTKDGQGENRRQWAMRQSKSALSDEDALKEVRKLEKRIKIKRSKNAK
jgi:hypothetical protein